MITLVKPILFAFIKTTAVKELIVKLLEAYAKSTDNTCLLYTSDAADE